MHRLVHHSFTPWLDSLPDGSSSSDRLLAYAHYVSHFEDTSSVIEAMLSEARDATDADGASLFRTTPSGRLRLAYFQNHTHSTTHVSSKNHYLDFEIPMDASSICGWAARERRVVNIPNVEHIDSSAPYTFNDNVYGAEGYCVLSLLTVPVIGAGDKLLAVIQLANRLSPIGAPVPFDTNDERYAELLAYQTSPYLTRSEMTHRIIETMLRISEMRDPLETGAHVQRVGAFAAEIFAQWAHDREMPYDEIAKKKSTLRLAAMLHDIGKVAIPDSILKKPGRLTEEEYAEMRTHCARGAQMYDSADTPLERAAYEITLHHHQRWDGRGYTGDPNVPPLAGDAIPIFARVTSAADVLDALAFQRSYKDAWSFDDVMAELQKCAGSQFDPEVVRAAVQISDTLRAIVDMYK